MIEALSELVFNDSSMEIKRSVLHLNHRDHNLFIQKWSNPSQKPKGVVIITHGISEHSNCYSPLASDLVRENWEVVGWDLPGHGKSSGARGYVSDFNEFIECLDFLSQTIKNQYNLPQIHLGHSMGGLITLKHALDKNQLAEALVLSSPALGITVPVPAYKDLAARIILRLKLPITMNNGLRYDSLSRDPEMVAKYKTDFLRHGKVSAPIYMGIIYAMAYVFENVQKLTLPCLFQVAGADALVDAVKTQELFNQMPEGHKELKLYAESFHEIYHDLNKREVIDDLLSYLRQFQS
jgi:alpha-beta hydrolase superfamily lysophospholipase